MKHTHRTIKNTLGTVLALAGFVGLFIEAKDCQLAVSALAIAALVGGSKLIDLPEDYKKE